MPDPTTIDADQYRTLAAPCDARLKEKGSVFLALARPVADAAEAEQMIAELWTEHHDATHIGWARRVAATVDPAELPAGAPPGAENVLHVAEKWSDDGEPAGSTGPPILHAIQRAELIFLQVAVVRWFGGTKLGVGGLQRAYGGAADLALSDAAVKTVHRTAERVVEVPHALAGAVYALADREGWAVGSPGYTETGLLLPLRVALSRAGDIEARVTEATAGRARVRP